jgi:hypothetical protein
MLIAAIAAAIAAALGATAGGGPDVMMKVVKDWKKALKRHVKDESTRDAAERVLDEYEEELFAARDRVQGGVKALGAVHRDYASTMEQYAAVIEGLGADLLESQIAMVDIALELQETVGVDTYDRVMKDFEEDTNQRKKQKAKADASERKKAEKAEKKAEKKK